MVDKIVRTYPKDACLHPTLIVSVELDRNDSREIITSVRGWLRTSKGTILAPLIQEFNDKETKLSAQGTHMDRDLFVMKSTEAQLAAQLDERALKEIDSLRSNTTKKAVDLTLDVVVSTLVQTVSIAHLHIVDTSRIPLDQVFQAKTGRQDAKPVAHWFDPSFSSGYANGGILSAEGGPTFIHHKERRSEIQCHVSADDWIHDFLPKFGLGQHVVLEIPFDGTAATIMPLLQKAEDAYARWDTKSVYANCREIGTVIDSQIKSHFGPESFTAKERWRRAYNNYNHMSSLDLHLEQIKGKYDEKEAKIGKHDAETVLIGCKNLVKYSQDLLAEPKVAP